MIEGFQGALKSANLSISHLSSSGRFVAITFIGRTGEASSRHLQGNSPRPSTAVVVELHGVGSTLLLSRSACPSLQGGRSWAQFPVDLL